MKYIFLVVILFICSFCANGQSLHGIITDSTTHQPIPGAVVYIPQLKMGTTTDINGNYKITLPKGIYEVEVEILGYATQAKQVNIRGDVSVNFAMGISSAAAKEVVVTALGNVTNQQRSPVPVAIVSHDMLIQNSSTNAVDAIAKQPGITEITTGPGVSKPEINGLGYNRVLTLFDGERQEDFQWGDEHGILIDPYAIYDVEIIRGPASLQYGNYAVAGVVDFKSEPFPDDGTTKGSVLTEYQTNNGLIGTSFDVTGNHNGLVWDLRASNEDAHSYWDPKDGYVWGTAFNQSAARLIVGINKQWGYSRLSISVLHRETEIPDGNRDSATGQFEFDVPQGNPQYYTSNNAPSPSLIGTLVPGTGQVYPTRSDFLSYNAELASVYQVLDHDEAWWQNSINAGLGRAELNIGYTQSERQEIDTGVITEEGLTVHDIPYDIKYQVAGLNSGLKLTTGVNGVYEWNTDFSEPPSPYVGIFEIPNYTDFDLGGYAILNWDPNYIKNLSLSGGLRYDYRTMNGQPMYLAYDATSSQTVVPNGGVSQGTDGTYIANSNQSAVPAGTSLYQQFPVFNRTFYGLSASFGATYQLPGNNYVKANIAKTYRAPSILELTSNETDPANEYKQGDPNLNGESGYETDVAYGYNGKDVNFEVDGFYNFIEHFIFADRISSKLGGDSLIGAVPVYHFGSSNTAILEGIAAYLNVHPSGIKWVELDNGFTYIYSYMPNQTDSTDHVPFTPAPRLTSEVKIKFTDRHTSILRATYIQFGLEKDWAQNNIYSALWNELPSLPYVLYNTGVGTSFVNPKTGKIICTFIVDCTNLTNIGYVDHTSREQYFWAYNGAYAGPANYGVTSAVVTKLSEGIYNMGRNVGFKLIFPIGGGRSYGQSSIGE